MSRAVRRNTFAGTAKRTIEADSSRSRQREYINVIHLFAPSQRSFAQRAFFHHDDFNKDTSPFVFLIWAIWTSSVVGGKNSSLRRLPGRLQARTARVLRLGHRLPSLDLLLCFANAPDQTSPFIGRLGAKRSIRQGPATARSR